MVIGHGFPNSRRDAPNQAEQHLMLASHPLRATVSKSLSIISHHQPSLSLITIENSTIHQLWITHSPVIHSSYPFTSHYPFTCNHPKPFILRNSPRYRPHRCSSKPLFWRLHRWKTPPRRSPVSSAMAKWSGWVVHGWWVDGWSMAELMITWCLRWWFLGQLRWLIGWW